MIVALGSRLLVCGPYMGTVIRMEGVAVAHWSGRIVITVGDDAKGIDPARVRAEAVERSIVHADPTLSDEEPYTWLMATLGSDRKAAERLLKADLRLLATDVSPSVPVGAPEGHHSKATLRTALAALHAAWVQGRNETLTI